MKTAIVITVLMAIVAGGHSAAQPATAQTATAQPAAAHPATTPAMRMQNRERENQAQLERSILLLREQARLLRQQRMFPPAARPRPASQPSWLLPLLATTAAASLVAATLQPLLFRRTRTMLQATTTAVRDVDARADRDTRVVLEKFEKARTDTAERIASARDATLEQLSSLSAELGRVREELARVTGIVERGTSSPPAAGDAVRLEHQVLAEHWRQFREKEDPGNGASRDEPWERLLDELSPLVPADLLPSFDAVMTPYREHRQMLKKLAIIPHVVKGGMPLATEAAELKRARDLTQLLIAVQSADDRLHFRFQSWGTDTFLPFADLYLQSYQKAYLERREGELQKGVSLVRQILRIVSVEPVDVTLGETRFDSTRHIGRFTSNDPKFPDGVITGVVRNGFVEGGHQVIRQPEVIVNRVR
ncbi:MAG: hypothetical protein ACXW5U_20405 [Thermoanaerobaculia bacterium]